MTQADFGFIHCIDEPADLQSIEKAGIIRYIEELKEKGVVRHIGLSSHTPELVSKVLDMGILDMLMFSINPAYGALDKPGVLTVLPGVRNMEDLRRVLGFCNAAPEKKDYSVLDSFALQRAMGKCVYCNHCRPCPAGLDVGLINKYYDLARSGDELAGNHYENLAVKAESCVRCGHCNSRCPFHVDQVARMQEIADYFNC